MGVLLRVLRRFDLALTSHAGWRGNVLSHNDDKSSREEGRCYQTRYPRVFHGLSIRF